MATGRAQLATELTISAEEFDVYNIFAPTTIAFHLREFNVCYKSKKYILPFTGLSRRQLHMQIRCH